MNKIDRQILSIIQIPVICIVMVFFNFTAIAETTEIAGQETAFVEDEEYDDDDEEIDTEEEIREAMRREAEQDFDGKFNSEEFVSEECTYQEDADEESQIEEDEDE